MQLTLISISRKVLDLPMVEWITIPTRDGEITILPDHEPLISALSPGILLVHVYGTTTSYAIGWGIVEVTSEKVTVTADMIEDGLNMSLQDVNAKKEEARKLLEEYKTSGDTMDMEKYIELEQQFLKESAREQLATR